jgi:hypothetical protein
MALKKQRQEGEAASLAAPMATASGPRDDISHRTLSASPGAGTGRPNALAIAARLVGSAPSIATAARADFLVAPKSRIASRTAAATSAFSLAAEWLTAPFADISTARVTRGVP